MSLLVRIWFVARFLTGHFSDAYALAGFLSLGLAAGMLGGHRRLAGVPAAMRGILLDLLCPCLLLTLALAQHHAVHSVSAIKDATFVTLAWTLLTPWLIETAGRSWRRRLRWAYGAIALLTILPFFPAPMVEWEAEGAFLRTAMPPGDAVF